MNQRNKFIGAGLFTAFAASLCCITPVVALIIGSSGMASTFYWFNPFRPYFIGLTILVLGFAWYQHQNMKKELNCGCEIKETIKFTHSKFFLGIVTAFTIVMLAFPYYTNFFFPNIEKRSFNVEKSNVQTAVFSISGMTCAGCEGHVNNEVIRLSGILKSSTSYESGNSIVEFDVSKTNTAEIETAINNHLPKLWA